MMHLSPVETVIWAFGGVRKTARAIGKNPTVISHWRKILGPIPSGSQRIVLEKAKELKLDLTADDLIFGRRVKTRKIEVPV